MQISHARTGKPAHELPLEGSRVRFSPDERWLATTGGGCRLWAVDSWQEGPYIGGAEPVFSADGKLLAVETGHGVVRLVNPNTGREYVRLEDPNQDIAHWMCFSSDGAQLVTINNSGSIHVWDLRTIRQKLATMELDWDLQSYPPVDATKAAPPLRVVVDTGGLEEPRAAIAKYSRAIALQPINPTAYLLRGRAYYSLRQWRQAADDWTLALAQGPAPHDPEIFFKRAYAHGVLSQPDKAIADYTKGLELAPALRGP